MSLVAWFYTPATSSCARLNEEKADSWVQPGLGGMKTTECPGEWESIVEWPGGLDKVRGLLQDQCQCK